MTKEALMKRWAVPLAGLLLSALVNPLVAGTNDLAPPVGTRLQVRLDTEISTQRNLEGDPVSATVVEPAVVGGQQIVPVNSTLTGRIARLKRPGRVMGRAEIRIVYDTLTLPNGRSYAISSWVVDVAGVQAHADEEGTIKGESSRKKDAGAVAGGAAAGAAIGGIAAGGAGAAIGAGAGGLIMLGDRLMRRGKHATLPAGSEMVVEIAHTSGASREVEDSPR